MSIIVYFSVNMCIFSESTEVDSYRAEARFLRAYAYYNLMDLFADVPLVTEITTALPEQASRNDIFTFVETELLEIQDQLLPAQSNEYGRVDQAAAWALLSRLYLNAEVYTGTAMYDKAVEFAGKVVNTSYSINTTDGNGNGSGYDELFLADNDTNGAQNENIFLLAFDGNNSQTYGGTTFLVHATIGGSMDAEAYGVNGGWAGYRTTKGLVEKFDNSVTNRDDAGDPIEWADERAQFYTDGQEYEIATIANTFTDGYALPKFKNVDVDGNPGSDTAGDFSDIDLPLIRLAEIYLNYAEGVVKGGGGDLGTAVDLVNELRDRAGATRITSGQLTAQFVLDERSRELHWEGLRRTDLIRYGQFTSGTYLWPFKGGTSNGRAVDSFRNIFPLPDNVLLINKNLVQNPGY